MRALYFDKSLRFEELPKPVPGLGEALIRIHLAGICNTDVEILKGYMGFRGVLGHEFVGVVEACDDADWIGRRVVGEINLGCGNCADCRADMARHCASRQVLGIAGKDGVMAEYATLPVANLRAVADSISDRAALFTEPLAAACEILEQVHLRPDDRVAIVGDGKLAWLVAQVLRLTGVSLSIHGHHEARCDRFRQAGFDAVVAPLPARAFDCVVEASGSPTGLEDALAACRPRGTVVLKSTVASAYALDLAPLVVQEIALLGSRCGRFEPALRLLERGLVEVEMLSATYSLDEFAAAFAQAASSQSMKIAFDLNP